MGYERNLDNAEAVDHFFNNCLTLADLFDHQGPITRETAGKRVRDAESMFAKGKRHGTASHTENRDQLYREDLARGRLRNMIVQELFTQKRLDDDEQIRLGEGGARPRTEEKADRVAYLVTGLPASGKSTIVSKMADQYGAFVVDSDYAKRKFPEFDGSPQGAGLVHEESAWVTLGSNYDGLNLLSMCTSKGLNIVRPFIGDERLKVDKFRDFLRGLGYKVHLTTVLLERQVATQRALSRFLLTNRYVPLGYIFDDCANDAALVYYEYRVEAASKKKKSPWASLGAICTLNAKPVQKDSWGAGNPASLF